MAYVHAHAASLAAVYSSPASTRTHTARHVYQLLHMSLMQLAYMLECMHANTISDPHVKMTL